MSCFERFEYSAVMALTASMADAGGPHVSSEEPMASQVTLTHESLTVFFAKRSAEFLSIKSMSAVPSFAPKSLTTCRRLTLSAVLRSPPMAKLSAISFSAKGMVPLSGSVQMICSLKLNLHLLSGLRVFQGGRGSAFLLTRDRENVRSRS